MNSKHSLHGRKIVRLLLSCGECSNTFLSAELGVVNPANRLSDARALGAPIIDRWVGTGSQRHKLYRLANKQRARAWLRVA